MLKKFCNDHFIYTSYVGHCSAGTTANSVTRIVSCPCVHLLMTCTICFVNLLVCLWADSLTNILASLCSSFNSFRGLLTVVNAATANVLFATH